MTPTMRTPRHDDERSIAPRTLVAGAAARPVEEAV